MANTGRDMASLKRRYMLDIELYERTYKKWESRGDKIVKRYRDERNELEQGGATEVRYNILWSNVQTTLPAVFARLPKPEVSRRFKDKDPVGRVASLMLERALEYEVEQYSDYANAVQCAVEDRLLPGRGVAWVRYEPVTKEVESPKPQITEDVESRLEHIDYECTPVDYVHWKDFGHNISRTWEEVSIVWRRVPLSREECISRFGKEIGGKVALDQQPELSDEALATPEGEAIKKATIYELWDKKEGIVVWLHKGYPRALDVRDDPLQLDNFFPCPKPLYATTTTDSLIPVPDYTQYQDQSKELDTICERIDGLVKAVKVVGVYDATQTGVQRMLNEGVANTLIPVDNWMMFGEKGGLKGTVEFLPLDMVVAALNALYLAREQAKQVIYEITGLSDIIRGSSDPNETLGAQELKGQFASKRLKKLQDGVAQFATELLRLKGQIICKHYQPESIATISGASQLSPEDQQLVPQAMDLLKQDLLSNFRIEVSSDSLVEVDEQQEKQNRMEFIQAIGGFIKEAIQAPPELAPMLGEVLLYGVRGFKAGKSIEGTIEETIDRMKQQAAQPKPPKQDPEVLKVQAQQQIEQMKHQGSMQLEQAKLQTSTQIEQVKASASTQNEQNKLASQQTLEMRRIELEAANEAKRIEQEYAFKMWQAQLDARTKIEVAEISSGATVASSQIKAASDAVNGEGESQGAPVKEQPKEDNSGVMAAIQQLADQVAELHQEVSAPVQYERGSDGKVVGITKGKRKMNVSYGPDGRMNGVA